MSAQIIDFRQARKNRPAAVEVQLTMLEQYLSWLRKEAGYSLDDLNKITIGVAIDVVGFSLWHMGKFGVKPPVGRYLRKNYKGKSAAVCSI